MKGMVKIMKKKILLIDPFYNNGALPPNYSLGEIERDLFNYFDISVSDFVRKQVMEFQ